MTLPGANHGASGLIDTHAHLDDPAFDRDRDEVVGRAKAAGLEAIVTVGCDVATSRRAVALAARYQDVFAAVGVHPHEASKMTDADLETLGAMAKAPKVVAYGEVGLDYHYDHSPRPVQLDRFRQQVRLAIGLGLPLIIHSREAWPDTLSVLDEEGAARVGGVFHCFTGEIQHARWAEARNFYLSFSGVLTFANAYRLQAVAREVPLDRLVIETDCPYLAPVPNRGRRNEPALVHRVGEMLASLKGVSLDAVDRATTQNAKTLFRLDGPATTGPDPT